jgi:hypothetical protein
MPGGKKSLAVSAKGEEPAARKAHLEARLQPRSALRVLWVSLTRPSLAHASLDESRANHGSLLGAEEHVPDNGHSKHNKYQAD